MVPVKRGRGRPKKDVTLAEEQKIRFLTSDYRLVMAASALDGKAPSVFIREAAVAAANARLFDPERNHGLPPWKRGRGKKGKP